MGTSICILLRLVMEVQCLVARGSAPWNLTSGHALRAGGLSFVACILHDLVIITYNTGQRVSVYFRDDVLPWTGCPGASH